MSIPKSHKTCGEHMETLLYFSCYLSCTRAPITAVLDTPYNCTFLNNPKFADKYRKTVMCSSCWLTCTRAPYTAVIFLAGTCPFASNNKHAENIEKQYCTPLTIEAVLVHPPLLYLIHLTPVPSCITQNLQTNIEKHLCTAFAT
jgi:hypothetical protein